MTADQMRWRDVVRECETRLGDAGSQSPAVDARRIVEQASGRAGADFHLALDDPVSRLGALSVTEMVERRCNGEPLQYVLGSWGFRHLDLYVDPRVLIPRPETEIVVDHALAEVDLRSHRDLDEPVVVVDLGTGSGAIALSLAAERSGLQIWATDRSADALAVARANLAGIGRRGATVRLAEGEWFDALPSELEGSIDLIVSNPPYVAEGDPLPAEVADWEPTDALIAGPLGSEAAGVLLAGATTWLARGGAIVLEISPLIEQRVVEFAIKSGLEGVRVEPDQLGRSRVLVARSPDGDRGSVAS